MFAVCGGFCFAKEESYYLEVDEYLGQPVETVEAVLGEPSEDGISTIYADYKNDRDKIQCYSCVREKLKNIPFKS